MLRLLVDKFIVFYSFLLQGWISPQIFFCSRVAPAPAPPSPHHPPPPQLLHSYPAFYEPPLSPRSCTSYHRPGSGRETDWGCWGKTRLIRWSSLLLLPARFIIIVTLSWDCFPAVISHLLSSEPNSWFYQGLRKNVQPDLPLMAKQSSKRWRAKYSAFRFLKMLEIGKETQKKSANLLAQECQCLQNLSTFL